MADIIIIILLFLLVVKDTNTFIHTQRKIDDKINKLFQRMK
jgi:hypothetical protein